MRWSTVSQKGKLPCVERVVGSDRIPPPIVSAGPNTQLRLPPSTTCAPSPWAALLVQAVERVPEARVEEPTPELELHLVELEVVALVGLVPLAGTIGEVVLEAFLVQVTDIGVDSEAHLAPFSASEAEPTAGAIAPEGPFWNTFFC